MKMSIDTPKYLFVANFIRSIIAHLHIQKVIQL